MISILTLDPAGLTDLAESGLLDDKAKAKVLSLLGQKQSAKAFVEAATLKSNNLPVIPKT